MVGIKSSNNISAFFKTRREINIEEVVTIVLPGSFEEVYQEQIDDYTYYYVLDHDEIEKVLQGFGLKQHLEQLNSVTITI